jgi:fructoselysine and glucoselysine-specific PTS system IID component
MLASYILITLIVMFGHSEDFLGTSLLSRPLVLAPLVGLALGDLTQGVIIGATLELIFMGNIKIGAAIPPDVITGGVLGTAFAIMSGKGASVALVLAVPISILAEMIVSGLFVFRSAFNKKFNDYAEEGNYQKIQQLHVLSGLLKPLLMGLITFISLQSGADVMKSFLEMIPSWVNEGLTVAGNMLPALGFALLLSLMYNKKVAPYFFLGFILTSYLKLPVIAIGGLGVIVALIITDAMPKADTGEEADTDTTGEDVINNAAAGLPKKTIRSLFFRSLAWKQILTLRPGKIPGLLFLSSRS